MATTPTGAIGKAQENLRTSLANCAAFQTWVGASGASVVTQAKNRIYPEHLPKPGSPNGYSGAELRAILPAAFIYTEEDASGFTFERTSADTVACDGALKVVFYDIVGELIEDDDAEALVRFRNVLDAILVQLNTNAVTYFWFDGGSLSGFNIIEPEQRATKNQCVFATLTLRYSGGVIE